MADLQELLLQQIKEQGELVRKLKAAKESSDKACVSNKGSPQNQYYLAEIDTHFSHHSYICGYTPTNCDVILANNLEKIDFRKYIYIRRWWNHVRSFSIAEVSQFPIVQPPDVMNSKPKGITLSIEVQETFTFVMLLQSTSVLFVPRLNEITRHVHMIL